MGVSLDTPVDEHAKLLKSGETKFSRDGDETASKSFKDFKVSKGRSAKDGVWLV